MSYFTTTTSGPLLIQHFQRFNSSTLVVTKRDQHLARPHSIWFPWNAICCRLALCTLSFQGSDFCHVMQNAKLSFSLRLYGPGTDDIRKSAIWAGIGVKPLKYKLTTRTNQQDATYYRLESNLSKIV